MKTFSALAVASFKRWWSRDPSSMGAAAAFYALLSLAPLSIFLVLFFGFLADRGLVEYRVLYDISQVAGTQAAQIVQTILSGIHDVPAGITAGLIGLATLIIGSLGIFEQIKLSLDKLRDGNQRVGFHSYIRSKALSFVAVFLLGCVLVGSIGLRAALALIVVVSRLHQAPELIAILGDVVSISLGFLLVAATYRFLPAIWLSWKASLYGSLVTLLLFMLGRFVIDLYAGHAVTASTYGAAGAIIIVLIWVYYTSQIFFFGAAWAVEIDVRTLERNKHNLNTSHSI